MGKPIDQHTRGEQTKFLSREFIIGLCLQLILLGGGGLIAFTRLEAKVSQVEPAKVFELQQKVAVLEANAVSPAELATLKQQMKNLEDSLLRVQAALDRNFYDLSAQTRRK